MRYPLVCFVSIKLVEPSDILGIAHALEDAHVPAAGHHISTVYRVVDRNHGLQHPLRLNHLIRFARSIRCKKVPPGDRSVRAIHRWDALAPLYLIACCQIILGLVLRIFIFKDQVECITLAVFRIYAISCKPATKSVGALMHQRYGSHDPLPVLKPAIGV